jgi:hypothetical protein
MRFSPFFQSANLVLGFFPGSTDCLDEISFVDLLPAGEIASRNFGIDFDSGIGRNQVL